MENFPTLSELRQQIDDLDAQILDLINARAKVALAVAEVKKATGGEVVYYRPEREREVLERVTQLNQGPLPNQDINRLFREIMSACLALESPLDVAYLGPEGTFTQEAAYKQFGRSVNAHAKRSITDIFKAVDSGACHYGVVPVENSTEGVITHTLDMFLNSALNICGEVKLRVNQNLLTHAATLSEITTVYSHAQSLAQCRGWLASNLSHAELVALSSNGEAARKASRDSFAAAIAGKFAAERYQLPMLFENIEDESNNTTRFLVIGRQKIAPTGYDKTSLIMSAINQSGALYNLLEPIQRYNLSMTKIESRPSHLGMWDYVFFIDLEGHQDTPQMQELFVELRERAAVFRVLGSYPRAD